jgi:hypothetical protein
VDQTSTLGASYTPPAGPQQFKVPTTCAPLKLRHVQVYAVTLRSKLQMLRVIIDVEKCWICLRGGEQSKDQATDEAKVHGGDSSFVSKLSGSGSVDPACRKCSPIYTLWWNHRATFLHLLTGGRGPPMLRTVTAEVRLHLNNNILAKYVCVGRRVRVRYHFCVHW